MNKIRSVILVFSLLSVPRMFSDDSLKCGVLNHLLRMNIRYSPLLLSGHIYLFGDGLYESHKSILKSLCIECSPFQGGCMNYYQTYH